MEKSRIEGIVESILRRSSYDKAFRELALKDIHTLMSKYGVAIPKDSKIRFVESEKSADDDAIVLPPLMSIGLQDDDLQVVVGDQKIRLARYENWSGGRINKLFARAAYENWGSE